MNGRQKFGSITVFADRCGPRVPRG